MRLPKRDVIATGLVALAGAFYLLWAVDSTLPGMSGTRATGMVVLGPGFAASASAVVPTFDQLLHGNKAYLVGAALLGLVAFVGGMFMLINASDAGLAVVMGAMVILWLIATVHHTLLARSAARSSPPSAVAH